ncbi:F-actin-monooxygenase Mical isoform X4 [Danaus plexippus]|uniref:F-actin-monooxygenase Mical isoform X4 n=1 Tax=Danaus plexippus TaxID=13037 RepID=UPI002AB211AF|nr:F-actin-monooxygenase Mical isoform X4 [Danaus plexippus]
MSGTNMNSGGQKVPTPPECALAAEMFDHFCSAGTMKQILTLHREICDTLNLKPNRLPDFYPKLKAKLASSWKAQALFKKFDARANHKVYAKGRACSQNKVLLIGAGPCGLRAAIECQLLGAKVVVIEKRDRFSRNNVLHLWPFVIHDLRALGAKKFFGKFCAGAIDHISIRQLQCILMKVSLLLGVEIHEGVSFEELLEPTGTESSATLGWRARVDPAEHPVSQYEFDALIGADGKRNTLQGFKRKEFRGKLAMAITANFINRHTEQEASVPEISGVAFIFNQKFFKELYEVTRIDLENIVYYKDDTHYFVMTAKKHSLLEKGVLVNDFADVTRLLSVENVDRSSLMKYAQEAARFSTDGRLPLKDFALNHYGEPDVALFDFTSMYAAENASIVYERHGRRLLCQLVGDSLLEPFWPTGSGCARGFLSALDAAWAVRTWGHTPQPHPLQVIAERESIYRLLAQTTPENLHRDFGAYTLDPGTRYPNLNRTAVTPHRVTSFYDSDDPLPLDAANSARKRRREPEISEDALLSWVKHFEPGIRAAVGPVSLCNLLRRYRPDLMPPDTPPRLVYQILQQEFGISPLAANGPTRETPDAKLRSYLLRVYHAFKGEVPHIYHKTDMFRQIKQSQQKENILNTVDHPVSAYTNTAEAEKSHSSHRKKRRSLRSQVSNDPAEYIRKKIEKLDLNNITHLARLIEGHDTTLDSEKHSAKQREIQEQIISLLDPEESPDPKMLRDSLAQLLAGTAKTKVKSKGANQPLNSYFKNKPVDKTKAKPPRKLKGLDENTIKYTDFSTVFDDDSANTDATIVETTKREKKKDLSGTASHKKMVRASSTEGFVPQTRRMSEVAEMQRRRFSQSPEVAARYGRSNSLGSPEMALSAKRMAKLFEDKKRDTPSPESGVVRSRLVDNPDMVLRLQRMTDIIEGKRCYTPSPDRSKRSQSIGNPEMALRRQRVVDLIEGANKPRQSPERSFQRRNSGELPFRLQRVSDMMDKRNADSKRPKSGGKRKAAREIMRQRFEKSLQMLAAEPRLDFASSADLENDYGLQQYRASAPQFDERVKKLEKKLQHYEEGRVVGGGARTVGGGARVARLAAELSNTSSGGAVPKASKPKDLMRSVGKIERDDWNVKEIERKIMENRLGRPEPKTAEKVPKWDREQFLGRQRRLKEGDSNEEKWGEIDETLHKLDQKLRDSGRPDHGTKKVANLATKFIKKDEPETSKTSPKEELKRTWRGPSSAGMQCASCGTRVFAAEAVTADGLHLHRSCFRCAVCKAVLRPGNYTMERYGSRLVCLRHSGVSVPDSLSTKVTRLDTLATPERISLEMSDGGAREIDEDEWTDRNFLASETSGAGGLSDEEDSSSEEFTDAMCSEEADDSPEPELQNTRPAQTHLYFSDDSFGYDDYSEEGAVSSGNESCSRMRAAREARRREVPAEPRPPTYSSEMESEEDSESSEDEVSSATEVSTDSEFAREECAPATTPPAILVTEAAPVAPVAAPAPIAPVAPTAPQDYPLSRTRSAGGLATKRALELKRKYLLGEPSPPSVKKSDSTSQLDTKLEAFRCNITEFQKLLNPAPIQPVTEQISVTMQMATTQSNEEPESDQSLPAKITQEPEDIASQKDRNTSPIELVPPKPIRTLRVTTGYKKVPMPDIISNLFPDAPLDLLEQGLSPFYDPVLPAEEGNSNLDHLGIDSDSLSEDDSSINQRLSNQSVPRVEVHDEGGELIQLDSLTIANNINDSKDDKIIEATNTTALSAVCVDSESSDSNKDVTTLALTETELSDWAAESAVLDECGFEEKDDRKRNKNPRTLSEPKMVHETKNISAIASHICGKTSPTEHIVFSNALEHFEFADEGDQDPSIESPATPKNEGYMELVDDYYGHYSPTNDRSMNFIERTFSETTIKPTVLENEEVEVTNDNDEIKFIDDQDSKSDAVSKNDSLKSTGEFRKLFGDSPSHSMSNGNGNEDEISVGKTEHLSAVIKEDNNSPQTISDSVSISDISPPLENDDLATKTSACKSENSNDKASLEDISPPLASEKSKSHNSLLYQKAQKPITFASPCSIRLYAPAICRSASETFGRLSKNGNVSPRYNDWGPSCHVSPGSISPGSGTSVLGPDSVDRIQVIQKERQEQTDLVKRLVLERLGNGQRVIRKTARRQRMSPVCSAPPPVPPPPVLATPPSPPPPPRPRPPPAALMSLPVVSSFSDPDLTQDRRRKGIMRSISNYFNRRLGPRHKCVSEPDLTTHEVGESHKSTGAFAPPVPPPPAVYSPSPAPPGNNPEEQAATVAELVQVSAQRDAHRALMAADRRRTSSRNRAGD